MTSFTPGPWKITTVGNVFADHGRHICTAWAPHKEDVANWQILDANARLIATAPELLAALKEARKCIAYCRRAHKDAQSGEGFPIEIFLDAVIAKATGAA